MTAFLENIEPFRGNGERNAIGQNLEEFLEDYDPYKYKNPCATTDAVVFAGSEKKESWKLLLIRRGNHPCIGWWALPGGFVNLRENLRETAKRELEEETGVSDLPMEQFAVYGNADRDPRARVITTAYLSVVEENQVKVHAGDDAEEALWCRISCKSGCWEEDDGCRRREHFLSLTNEEKKLNLWAKVEERVKGHLVVERDFEVKETNQIACDHAAIIVQAWLILQRRLVQ
ncbi:MAG: NUDIX hydrolase [Bariatricus sp.]|nr:NUDIX hydrolase [Bariatricus sp.]